MKLLTKEIINTFKKYPRYSQEYVNAMDKKVIVKFFNPYGAGTWLITEAERDEENDDWLLYGLANIGFGYEWGYISFKELDELRINVFGYKMPIERDMYLGKNCKVGDLVAESELM